jgi:hypothetical protein
MMGLLLAPLIWISSWLEDSQHLLPQILSRLLVETHLDKYEKGKPFSDPFRLSIILLLPVKLLGGKFCFLYCASFKLSQPKERFVLFTPR